MQPTVQVWKISHKKLIFTFSKELFEKQRVKYSKMAFLGANFKKKCYWRLGIIILLFLDIILNG